MNFIVLLAEFLLFGIAQLFSGYTSDGNVQKEKKQPYFVPEKRIA